MNVQSSESKCRQRLVYPANHDASIVCPICDVAFMGQCAAHIDHDHPKTQDPEDGKETIDQSAHFRADGPRVVEEARDKVGRNCENAHGDQLDKAGSVGGLRKDLSMATYHYERPWHLIMLELEMMDEEGDDARDDDGRYQLRDADDMESCSGIL